MSPPAWKPLRKPVDPVTGTTSTPFARLALVHAFALAGDTLITIALADSLFFNIQPGAARVKVALYLALTIAPFAVVAPLLAPALDQTRGGRRAMLIASLAGRAFLCVLMADDFRGLLLFPEAFTVLVLSKTYMVAKSALVPAVVARDDELVEANSKLALLGVVMGFVAAVPGVALLKMAGAEWTLGLGSLVFAAGAVASWRVPRADVVADPPDEQERAELRASGVVLAASAMGMLRGIVGFLTFLVAFAFRSDTTPSWWFGVVLAASAGGFLAGALVAPRLRERLREETILVASLGAVAVVGLAAGWAGGRLAAAVVAGTVGVAASAGKLAFDSLVQRDAPDAARGRSFARFETRFQLVWVIGAAIPVVVPIPLAAGLVLVALAAAFAAVSYLLGRRVGEHRAGGTGAAVADRPAPAEVAPEPPPAPAALPPGAKAGRSGAVQPTLPLDGE